MDINLFDSPHLRENLKPFTFTRPLGDIRIGILTIKEKWEALGAKVGFNTIAYLSHVFEGLPKATPVNGSVIPTAALSEVINALSTSEGLWHGELFVAGNIEGKPINWDGELITFSNTWNIFELNRAQIIADLELIKNQVKFVPLNDPHTIV